ncbi:MAG: hypothetical protein KGY99_02415 [Phycisphaerae bacterium]|nr:hypothetical protein [Phycisphaerae bacterium]
MQHDSALRTCWQRLNGDRAWPVALAVGVLGTAAIPWLHTSQRYWWPLQMLAQADWRAEGVLPALLLCVWATALGVMVAGLVTRDRPFAWILSILPVVAAAAAIVFVVQSPAFGGDWWRLPPALLARLDALNQTYALPAALMAVFVVSGARVRSGNNSRPLRWAQGSAGLALTALSALATYGAVAVWLRLRGEAPGGSWPASEMHPLPHAQLRVGTILAGAILASLLGAAAGIVGVAHAWTAQPKRRMLAKVSAALAAASVWAAFVLAVALPALVGAAWFSGLMFGGLCTALALPVFLSMGLVRLIPLWLARRAKRAEPAQQTDAAQGFEPTQADAPVGAAGAEGDLL